MQANDTIPLCQCGCGAPVTIRKGKPNRYIRGHGSHCGRRVDPNPSRMCQCGCGQPAPSHYRYLPYHHKLKSLVQYEVDPVTGCWNWLRGTDDNGYALVRDGGKVRRAHTVFYERLRGKPPVDSVPHHTCENHGCINPFHIEWKTRAEHASLHHALLTPEQIAEIRALKGRMSQRDIAKVFGISRGAVRYHLARAA